MGTWGYGSFENDAAGDWKDTLVDSEDGTPIARALEAVTNMPPDEYLEIDEAQSAVAAAEVVACLKGARPPDLPPDVEEWLEDHGSIRTLELVPLALRALERVRTDSELKELVDEGNDSEEWYNEIENLQARLLGDQ